MSLHSLPAFFHFIFRPPNIPYTYSARGQLRVGQPLDILAQYLSEAGEITAIDYIGSRVEITIGGGEKHWASVGKLTETGDGGVKNAHVVGGVEGQVTATTTRLKSWQVNAEDLEEKVA